ncbi:MAG: metallophosphatase family protein [Chloroflexota bacterium]|nr:metallophosphatase family protein [Chloroflexota bacterium]
MKIAALYDIHGNLPALNAVLEELESVRPDVIVVGGDIISGPMPRQTLDRLRQLGDQARYIRGNGDREVVAAFDGLPLASGLPEEVREVQRWTAQQLERSQRDFLAQLPEHITLHVEGLGDVLFCHATPRNDEEIFTPITPQQQLDTIFAGIEQPVVVCGHTHMQFERQVGSISIINAGSVGMPYADHTGAYWLLLGPGSEFRRTMYDVEEAAQQVRESGYPQAQDFAAENVLTVPTAAQAIAAFEPMAAEG